MIIILPCLEFLSNFLLRLEKIPKSLFWTKGTYLQDWVALLLLGLWLSFRAAWQPQGL